MINLNVEPYYDDFNESSKFYKILFKPGYAVQARELTQLQSIIQKQIDRFGSYVFKDGSIVHGVTPAPLHVHSIAIKSYSANDLSYYKNKIIFDNTNPAIKKQIVHTENINSINYIFVIDLSDGDILENSNLSVQNDSSTLIVESSIVTNIYTKAVLHQIFEGIYFVNGVFAKVEEQIIVVSANSANPSMDVYLVVTESVVTHITDESLLDNAFGSPNYAAPGADRYSIDLTLSTSLSGVPLNNSNKNFLIASYREGTIIKNVNEPELSDLEKHLADRTFKESGNYTVVPFIGKMNEDLNDNTKTIFKLDAGDAFVQGYEFKTQAQTSMSVPKARTTAFLNNSQVQIDKGPYVLVVIKTGTISPYVMTEVNIYSGLDGSGIKIGTATAFGTVYDSGLAPNKIYKLFITNIAITSITLNITNAQSFTNNNFSANYSTVYYSANSVVVQNTQNFTNIYPLANTPVKTHINSTTNNTDLTYQYYKVFNSPSVGGSGANTNKVITLTVPPPQSFILSSTTNMWTVTDNLGVLLPIASVDVIDNTNVTITLVTATTSVIVYGVISESSSNYRLKTLASFTATSYALTAQKISLLRADGIRLVSVVDNLGNDHTSKYSFYSGQTDTIYDHAYISLISPSDNPKVSFPDATALNITFDYYNHSGNGPIIVDSYASLTYENIPSYRTGYGEIIRLADAIDFRPRRRDDSTSLLFDTYYRPHFNSSLATDYEYYLPRIDRVAITVDQKLALIQGIPAKYPLVPDASNAMTLYILTVPAYTFKYSDVIAEYVDNRRYTMSDIGKLDKRVQRLEYYTSLSLLEKQANDESIPSEVAGIDKFKNGILVDPFAGHSVGDVFNPDYNCSIDFNNRFLRPAFISNQFNYDVDTGKNVSTQVSNDHVTLSYTEIPVITQTDASEYESVQPFGVFVWNGIMALDPPTDIWTDTKILPEAIINANGEFDGFNIMAQGNGQIWSDYANTGTGITNLSLNSKVDVKSNVLIIK